MTDTQIKVLVTGANGFVGSALCRALSARDFDIVAAVRNATIRVDSGSVCAPVGTIDGQTDWSGCLAGVKVVFHLAARVHVMQETHDDPLVAFRAVNLDGTENLARQAARAGVRRFVYVSSVKVNGERNVVPFVETASANPLDPYGVSKHEAEQRLYAIQAETGMEVVIVRPPLVYGPGVKGNFAQMIHVVRAGVPLPLASVNNRRSLVFVGNLVDALILTALHPAAAGKTYFVSDGEDVSTGDLLHIVGAALGRPARLLPCPIWLLRLVGRLTRKSEQVDRLVNSLTVDIGKIRYELNWKPLFSLREGLRRTAGTLDE